MSDQPTSSSLLRTGQRIIFLSHELQSPGQQCLHGGTGDAPAPGRGLHPSPGGQGPHPDGLQVRGHRPLHYRGQREWSEVGDRCEEGEQPGVAEETRVNNYVQLNIVFTCTQMYICVQMIIL